MRSLRVRLREGWGFCLRGGRGGGGRLLRSSCLLGAFFCFLPFVFWGFGGRGEGRGREREGGADS